MSKRMNPETKAKQDVALKQYEATAQEGEALRNYIARVDEKTAPTITLSEDGKKLLIDHPIQKIGFLLVVEALGTTSAEFAIDLIMQLMAASREGTRFNSVKFKAMLAMVINGKPRNEKDAAMEVLAAITHQAAVKTARQMDTAENVMQQESTQRMYKGLVRSFIDLKDALTRGRAAAESTFTVQQNVNVADGGRAAVVTNVTHTQQAPTDVQNESPAASPLALTDAGVTPMPIIGDSKERAVIPEQIQRFRPN
jgi:hypothetical protein